MWRLLLVEVYGQQALAKQSLLAEQVRSADFRRGLVMYLARRLLVIGGEEAAIVDDAAAARRALSSSPLKPLRHFSRRRHGIGTKNRVLAPLASAR